MTKRRRKPIRPSQGLNTVLIAGLPREALNWVLRQLESDDTFKAASYVGAPAPSNDWGKLYRDNSIKEIGALLEGEFRSHVPNRLIILYVPSWDAMALLAAVEYVCYLAPMTTPSHSESPPRGDALCWRHDKAQVKDIVYRTLRQSLNATNALKSEITDPRISPSTLPSRNFHYPSDDVTISDTYSKLVAQQLKFAHLKESLTPKRFTREQLPQQAFKGKQYTDEFFEDFRGRVFPPDPHHGHNRESNVKSTPSFPSQELRQQYRFGVTVRNGHLHYDVQYTHGRSLTREPMYCSVVGDVWVDWVAC